MSSIASSPAIVPSPSPVRKTRTVAWKRFALRGLATVAAAVLANVLVYFLGGAFVTYDPQFIVLVDVSGVVIFTLTAAIIAVLVYAPVLRFARRPARTYTIIAAAVLVVTVIPDFTYIPTVQGSSNAQIVILVLTHIVAASVIVPMLTSFTRARAR
jgi:hypothetical protein